jgi:hypothetical protein
MPSRRAALIGLAAALAVGLVVLLAAGITTRGGIRTTIGVLPIYPMAPIAPGSEACQSPVALADPVERLRFNIGQFGKRGVPLTVSVRSAGTPNVLASARIAGGWADNGTPQDVRFAKPIAGDQRVSVCVRNDGRITSYVYGDLPIGSFGTGTIGVRPTNTTNEASVDGVPLPGDIALAFVSPRPRSLLSRLPDAFRHAAAFAPVGPWAFWLLALAMLVAVPLALARALQTSLREPERDGAASLPSPER